MATYVVSSTTEDPSKSYPQGMTNPTSPSPTPGTGTQTAPAGTISGGAPKTPEAVESKRIGVTFDGGIHSNSPLYQPDPYGTKSYPQGMTNPAVPEENEGKSYPQRSGNTFVADPFEGALSTSAPVAVEPGMLAFDEEDEEEDQGSTLAPSVSLRPLARPTGLAPTTLAPDGFGVDGGLLGEVKTETGVAPEGYGIEPAPVVQPEAMGSNAVLLQKEQEYALPDNYLHVMWQIESSSGADLTGDRSAAAGHFAFMPATAEQYGLEDPNDLEQSADAAARLARDNAEVIAPVLGRAPTGPELYLAHQQGAYGARALLQNPDALAVDIAGYDNVALNVPEGVEDPASLTAQQFVDFWNDRYWDKASVAAAVQGWSGSPSNDGGRSEPQVADAGTASDGVPHAHSASTASQPQTPAFSRANPTPGPVPPTPFGLGGVMAFYDEAEPQPVPYGLESPSIVHAPTSRRYSYNPVTGMIEEV